MRTRTDHVDVALVAYLRHFAEAKSISHKEIAKTLGIGRCYFSALMTNRNKFSAQMVLKICVAFKCQILIGATSAQVLPLLELTLPPKRKPKQKKTAAAIAMSSLLNRVEELHEEHPRARCVQVELPKGKANQ